MQIPAITIGKISNSVPLLLFLNPSLHLCNLCVDSTMANNSRDSRFHNRVTCYHKMGWLQYILHSNSWWISFRRTVRMLNVLQSPYFVMTGCPAAAVDQITIFLCLISIKTITLLWYDLYKSVWYVSVQKKWTRWLIQKSDPTGALSAKIRPCLNSKQCWTIL